MAAFPAPDAGVAPLDRQLTLPAAMSAYGVPRRSSAEHRVGGTHKTPIESPAKPPTTTTGTVKGSGLLKRTLRLTSIIALPRAHDQEFAVSLNLRASVRAIILDEDDRVLLCRFDFPHPAVPNGTQ